MPELLGISQKSLGSFLASSGTDMDAYMISNRSLSIMNSVLKELSSIKMPNGLRVTGQVRHLRHQCDVRITGKLNCWYSSSKICASPYKRCTPHSLRVRCRCLIRHLCSRNKPLGRLILHTYCISACQRWRSGLGVDYVCFVFKNCSLGYDHSSYFLAPNRLSFRI